MREAREVGVGGEREVYGVAVAGAALPIVIAGAALPIEIAGALWAHHLSDRRKRRSVTAAIKHAKRRAGSKQHDRGTRCSGAGGTCQDREWGGLPITCESGEWHLRAIATRDKA